MIVAIVLVVVIKNKIVAYHHYPASVHSDIMVLLV